MRILVTGTAGFVGYHLTKALLEMNNEVLGLDSLNSYYSIQLKEDRLRELGIAEVNQENIPLTSTSYEKLSFIKLDLAQGEALNRIFAARSFDLVIHLAAQAGVRYSIENPDAYIHSNITGFHNIIEACRHHGVKKFIYASSSSVYGNTKEVPFHEKQNVDKPVSLYAATKKSNELQASVYSHLYSMSCIGLRFFTVYGPWGRPDMAPFLFASAVLNGKKIKVFNNGDLRRDFTYVDDIVEGILAILKVPFEEGTNKIFNIGNNKPEQLMYFIELIEKYAGKEAQKDFLPMQAGDVYQTFADTSALENYCAYKPKVSLDKGLEAFMEWYKSYFNHASGS